MPSRLETIPLDVLQHIAFLLGTLSVIQPPRHLFNLLLASTKIHNSLSIDNCPHLYADIFRTTFDVNPRLRPPRTDSAIAVELLRRYRVLYLARKQDASALVPEDLRAALRMVLENEGRNEKHLAAAGFLAFTLSIVQAPHKLRLTGYQDQVKSLTMWLLCLTITHKDVIEMTGAMREHLRRSLCFPNREIFLMSSGVLPLSLFPLNGLNWTENLNLDYSAAAIIMAFALSNPVLLEMPAHIPLNRAIALAMQQDGPTVEDIRSIASYRTPLFADLRHALMSDASAMPFIPSTSLHDPELCRLSHISYNISKPLGRIYTPGSLVGLWEGRFMISSPTNDPIPGRPRSENKLGDFEFLKPMQCAISEHLCFSPHLPLPADFPIGLLPSKIHSRKCVYEKYSTNPSNGFLAQPRDPNEALDVVIIGETLPDHEQAWGGYKFAGRVRPDGTIILIREPKYDDDGWGATWILEGQLRYGFAFVGQIRSGPTLNIRGIFSLRRTGMAWE